MDFWDLAIRIIFLSQVTTGILGNLTMLLYFLIIHCGERTLKPIDLILMNIMVANALSILSAGVPKTMAVWGYKQFFNDFGCHLLLYIQGFSRSVSIATTCLLSIIQALTISPKRSWWKDHKVKVEKYIGCHMFLLWILYMFVNFVYLAYIYVNINSKNVTKKLDFEYCTTSGQDEISFSLYAALVVCPEIFFSVLMAWSSRSMIVILRRHKQNVQHIRSNHGSSRNCPESRVTQNIIILVSTFLAFYTLSSLIRGFIVLLYNNNWWLVTIDRLICLCFPSFGPFVLMNHYSIVSRHCLLLIRNKKSLNIILSMQMI